MSDVTPVAAHPPIPNGTATKAGLGGAVAGIAMGLVGWAIDQTLNPEDVVLIASGIGSVIAVVVGRSGQAKEAIRAFADSYLRETTPLPADQEETVDPDPTQDETVAIIPLEPTA